MLDYIAAGDVRRSDEEFIKTMNSNHKNKSMTHKRWQLASFDLHDVSES